MKAGTLTKRQLPKQPAHVSPDVVKYGPLGLAE